MKKIILVGHAASGKDYLRKKFQGQGFRFAVTHTTRPIRPGEVDGEDCHFISREEFQCRIDNQEFKEYDEFNGWYYGTLTRVFEESDVFTMTVGGVAKLSKEERDNSFVIFIDIPEETRLQRLSEREMPGDDKERRVAADREDFRSFTDFDMRVTNSDF